MMSRDAVLTHVRETMVDLFELEASKVTEETRLIDDLGLDSIDAIDLAARIEEFTKKRLPEEKLRELRTVGDVIDLILALSKGLPAAEPAA